MKTKIVILAAGKGTRMGSELPKALVLLDGKPMISYLAESVVKADLDDRPIVVVSPDNREVIQQALSSYNWDYAVQTEQLGTGHAVACAQPLISEDTDNVVVLYCDQPFVTAASLRRFGEVKADATIMTTELGDFNDWRQNFYHLGRIIRNAQGMVEKIVEFKDASPSEIAVTEINVGFVRFNSHWLWENIKKLKNDNKQKEYYLTTLIEIACQQGLKVDALSVDPKEALGINSFEELKIAEGVNC